MANGSEKRWVFFKGMDHTKWKDPRLPSLKEIDEAAAGAPVFVSDISFHRGIISSEAMLRAGIRRQNLRWPSDVDVNRDGTLKGLIWEDAVGLMFSAMFRQILSSYSREEKRKLIADEADRLLACGLTHVHDPGLPWDVQDMLRDARGFTKLKLSWSVTSYETLFAPPGLEDEEKAILPEIIPKSVKFFLDGAHRTAASMPVIAGLKSMVMAGRESLSTRSTRPFRMLFEQQIVLKNGKLTLPYKRFNDTGDLMRRAAYFTDKGYRLVIHALGNDAAVQAAEVVRSLKPAGGASIEHLIMMGDEELDIFAGCGAVASIQPGFIPHYSDALESYGIIPYLKVFPLKSLLKRGVSVCISSDGPCGADDPLHNIRRGADRKRNDGSMFDPDEALSREQALAAGTIGASASLGIRNEGLAAGSPATFCIVDGDPFLDTSSVVQTWIDGERVY
ncbi:hypothetical protein EG829_14750 [bacterium]|nr:hypothetical protein [bacterium]